VTFGLARRFGELRDIVNFVNFTRPGAPPL
jgi:hypothetical protein